MKQLLTAAELGDVLGLKPGTILDRWQRGELPGYRFGRAVRFDLDEILELGRAGRRGRESASDPTATPSGAIVGIASDPQRKGNHD